MTLVGIYEFHIDFDLLVFSLCYFANYVTNTFCITLVIADRCRTYFRGTFNIADNIPFVYSNVLWRHKFAVTFKTLGILTWNVLLNSTWFLRIFCYVQFLIFLTNITLCPLNYLTGFPFYTVWCMFVSMYTIRYVACYVFVCSSWCSSHMREAVVALRDWFLKFPYVKPESLHNFLTIGVILLIPRE